jgi:hypothetical protein
LRDNLANLFEGIDDYADVVDPVTQAELTKGRCPTTSPRSAWPWPMA